MARRAVVGGEAVEEFTSGTMARTIDVWFREQGAHFGQSESAPANQERRTGRGASAAHLLVISHRVWSFRQHI